jgi:nucleoside-triphosphatase THEP1
MIVIISGASGSGKTGTCAGIAEKLEANSVANGGVFCPALFESGYKVAISVRYLGANSESKPSILARVIPGREADSPRGQSPHLDLQAYGPDAFSYGKWVFNRKAIEVSDLHASMFINTQMHHMEERVPLPGAVAIIDEIGPLELDYELGFIRTLGAIDALASLGQASAIDCIISARPDIASRLSARWPGCRVINAGQTIPLESLA